jgi:hypothetical protein
MGNPSNASSTGNKTWLGVVLGIIAVIPAVLVAGIITKIYTWTLSSYVSGHWIPYLEEISLTWFPEIFRGFIAGAIAIAASTKFVKTANQEIVRYSVFTFWGGATILLTLTSQMMTGFNFVLLLGAVALLAGFGAGLWTQK